MTLFAIQLEMRGLIHCCPTYSGCGTMKRLHSLKSRFFSIVGDLILATFISAISRGAGHPQSRLEAPPTLRSAESWEGLPAATFESPCQLLIKWDSSGDDPGFSTSCVRYKDLPPFSKGRARYRDVPPFLMAASHRKRESLENHVFRVTMSKKSHGWLIF